MDMKSEHCLSHEARVCPEPLMDACVYKQTSLSSCRRWSFGEQKQQRLHGRFFSSAASCRSISPHLRGWFRTLQIGVVLLGSWAGLQQEHLSTAALAVIVPPFGKGYNATNGK